MAVNRIRFMLISLFPVLDPSFITLQNFDGAIEEQKGS
jgi:hypothetical protein